MGVYAAAAQVEFYFSDENLPTDTFLIKQVTSNAEGWGECLRAPRTANPLAEVATYNVHKALFIL